MESFFESDKFVEMSQGTERTSRLFVNTARHKYGSIKVGWLRERKNFVEEEIVSRVYNLSCVRVFAVFPFCTW